MNSNFFKNTSTEAHVDLGSIHMTVKQPINSVKKKSIDSIKTSNRLFAVMKIDLRNYLYQFLLLNYKKTKVLRD